MAFSSCGTSRHAAVFRPDNVQLNVAMDDLQYLGECKISISYDTYLGLFTRINEVNGQPYNSLERNSADIQPFGGILSFGPINLAAFKVLEQYPNASYFMPVCQTKTTTKLLMGRETTITATVRAYQFK